MIFSWNMQPKILENEKITLYISLDFGYIIIISFKSRGKL